jgi:hypothetical protein
MAMIAKLSGLVGFASARGCWQATVARRFAFLLPKIKKPLQAAELSGQERFLRKRLASLDP